MGLIVPILPGPVSVDFCVHSSPAWHGSRHVRQLGKCAGRSFRGAKEVEGYNGEGTVIIKIDFQLSHRMNTGTFDEFWKGGSRTGFDDPYENRGD